MNFLDKKRTEKLVFLIFNRVETDKSIKLDFAHEVIDNVNKEVLYANIELNDKECKIINKLKNLNYFSQLISQNFNFVDQNGRLFSSKKIEYFYTKQKIKRYKIKITLTEVETIPKENNSHNYITQIPNVKSDNDCKSKVQTSGLKTTTQKYLNMNHSLIRLRDDIFDPDVVGEKDEDEKTRKQVIDALDVLCHYLDDYKESNGVRTRIKE